VEVALQLQQWQTWVLNQLMEQLILQRVAVYLVEREPVQKQNQVRGSQAEPS
jgi:hypothetical protein